VAQIAPGDPSGNQTIPEKDLSRPAEGGTQNGNTASDGNQSLSDKLDESGGVIKPAEGVDPQIVQPAPHRKCPEPGSIPAGRSRHYFFRQDLPRREPDLLPPPSSCFTCPRLKHASSASGPRRSRR
jgi:hypothetical protein